MSDCVAASKTSGHSSIVLTSFSLARKNTSSKVFPLYCVFFSWKAGSFRLKACYLDLSFPRIALSSFEEGRHSSKPPGSRARTRRDG